MVVSQLLHALCSYCETSGASVVSQVEYRVLKKIKRIV